MSSVVPVLNSADLVLHRVSVKHAIQMLVRKVVVIVEDDPSVRFGPWNKPVVVRLVRDIFAKWMYMPAICTRAGVLRRDGHLCGYCGLPATTVDHVLPASRGGGLEWDNAVAACVDCNCVKADRTPREAGMPLRVRLWSPRRIDLYQTGPLHHRRRTQEWT